MAIFIIMIEKAEYNLILKGLSIKGIPKNDIVCCYIADYLYGPSEIDFGHIPIEDLKRAKENGLIFVSIPKIKKTSDFTPQIYDKYVKYIQWKIKYIQMKNKMSVIDKDFE